MRWYHLRPMDRIPWWAGLAWRCRDMDAWVIVPMPLAPLVRGLLRLWWWSRTGSNFRSVNDSQRLWLSLQDLREEVRAPGFTPEQVAMMAAMLKDLEKGENQR